VVPLPGFHHTEAVCWWYFSATASSYAVPSTCLACRYKGRCDSLPNWAELPPANCVQGAKAGFMQLLSFQLPPCVPRANILLLGPPGAGKSSLVSTLDALLRGGLTRRADYGGATTSLTLALRRYTFTAGVCELISSAVPHFCLEHTFICYVPACIDRGIVFVTLCCGLDCLWQLPVVLGKQQQQIPTA
jgi:hypothetical protein